jgi:hypothetical protein
MKKITNILLGILAVFCYVQVRVLSVPLFWRGIPNLEYWMKDTERASSQIKLTILGWFVFLQVYFFGWIGVISSVLWVLLGILYFWFQIKEKKK